MAKRKRVVRSYQPRQRQVFDDYQWPIDMALVVLGGFMIGSILVYQRFSASNWYASAWVSMILVILLIAGTIWTLRSVGNRFLRRTMQLSVVVCAIFHLLMLIVAFENDIFSRIWQEPQAANDVSQKKPVTIAEYHPSQMNPQQQVEREVDQPVETEVPDPAPREIERPDEQKPQTPTPPQPQPIPEPVEQVRPEVVKQRTTSAVAQPRQSEQQAKLSRREKTEVKSQNAAVTVPQEKPAARDSNPQLQASRSAVTRTQAAPQQQRKQATQEPAKTVSQQANNVRRATAQQQQPTADRSAQATMQRRTVTAPQVPRTQVVPTQQSAVSQKTPAPAPQPANTVARQSATAAPQRTETARPEATTVTSQATAQRRNQQQPAPQKPTLAQTPQPVSNRSPRLTQRISPQTQTDVATPQQPAPAASRPLTAQNSSVSKATTASQQPFQRREPSKVQSPTATASATQAKRATRQQTDPAQNVPQVASQIPRRKTATQTPANAPVAATATAKAAATASPAATQSVQANTTAVARSRATSQANAERSTSVQGPAATAQTSPSSTAVRSTRSVGQPVPASAATASSAMARAQQQSQVAVSPQAVAQPSGATQTARQTPTSQPSQTAVAKATSGVAGRGKSKNIDRALSAASNQAPTASNAAARSRATQQNKAGPQLAPAAVAQLQRSRAGAERPSAALAPNAVELPNAVASSQPAQTTVDAAASVQRSASQAEQGAVTAAKGNVEVDLGATQLVDQQNVGRASGGGQPEVSAQPNAAPATQAGKAAARAMILSSQVAATVASPSEVSVGQSAATIVQAAAASVVRPATENRTEAGSQSASTAGTAGPATPQPTLTQTTARRAQRDPSPADGSESENENQQEQGIAVNKSASQQLPSSLTENQTAAVASPSSQADQGAASPAASGAPAELEIGKVTAGAEASLATNQPASATDPAASNPASSGSATAVGPAVSRAEATEGASGQPELGGGTAAPQQPSQGRPLLTPQISATASVAGAAQSAGVETGVPVEAQGDPAGRQAGGINAPATDRSAGAATGATVVEAATTGTTGITAAKRQRQSGSAAGPQETPSESPGGAVTRANVGRGLPASSTTATIELPGNPGGSPAETEADASISGAQTGPVARRATDNLPVRVDAEDGVGGLGNQVAADAGINSRRASPDSVQVQIQPGRFLNKTSRGLPSFNTRAAVSTDSFQGRKRPDGGGGAGAGDPQTEEAIDLGLAFLARNQLQEGRWSLSQFANIDGQPAMSSDTAATALAVLAFQGAGYNHQQYKYQQVLRNGLQFLLTNQAENGDLYLPQAGTSNQVVRLYSHAIATLALCEAYGMTQDPNLRDQVQKAIDFVVASQHSDRGGWRYTPGRESDTSVSGWMLMALESGRRANLKVPAKSFDQVRVWLDKAADPDEKHLYRYNPYAADNEVQGAGRRANATMTSVGLLMRLYTGWKTNQARTIRGADYLKEHLPSLGLENGQTQRDTYYWYYATQFMFHMGGEHWKAWHDRLHPLLVNSQIRQGEMAGSWDFRRPVLDRWGPHAGRVYLTTMNLLSLEVHYRHLPLYEDGSTPAKKSD